jgi:hypothetical protein
MVKAGRQTERKVDMYIKVLNVVGTQMDGYILECKEFSWEHVEKEEHSERLVAEANEGDYGMYEDGSKISLVLVLDDMQILLECGSVYVMNEHGKTIDSIHA